MLNKMSNFMQVLFRDLCFKITSFLLFKRDH